MVMLGTISQDSIGFFLNARCIRRRLSLLPLTLLAYNGTVWANGESLPEGVSGRQQDKPNILIILCDDLGYGDLACYGQPYIQTPHIDRLASEGMLFTQAYAGSPVSAPSRASLMTGQHTGHCAIRGNREYWSGEVAYGQNRDYAITGQHPLDTAHIILPEIMKEAGYHTGQFGKWAGGYEGSESTPDKRGIDEFYGYICQYQAHLYYPNFLNRFSRNQGDTAVVREILQDNIQYPMSGTDYRKRTQYSADLIHQHALKWIDHQQIGEPFFGLLAYTLPHAELVQPNDSIVQHYIKQFKEDKDYPGNKGSRYNATQHTHAQFAAMISRMDCYVGELMHKLEEKGLAENTLVIFTSDNGPHEEGGADPKFFGRDGKLKGLKRSCHEGGIRIPFIVCWPGHVAPGSRSEHQLAFWDIMPTLCQAIGLHDPTSLYKRGTNDHFDGLSFLPTLEGRPMEQRIHDHLYWEFGETDQVAVRRGNWKMVVKHGKPFLYDLGNDIHEDHDLSKSYPGILQELIRMAHEEHTHAPLFPVTMPTEVTERKK